MATTSPVDRNGPQRRFRNYLLDSSFQFKYARLLVLVALGVAALMGAALFATTGAVVTESARVVEESRRVIDESQKVSDISRMNARDLAADSPELLAEFRKQVEAHDHTMAERQKALAANQAALIHRQRVMMASLIGGLCLMFTVISLYGIYFTHRVAGPIFKMRRLLRQLEGGVYPVDARLRKDDELRGFFEDFIHLAASLKDRDARRAATVDSMLAKLATEPQADIKISLELFRSELIGAEAAASTHPAASP